jgi:hypothetical protein
MPERAKRAREGRWDGKSLAAAAKALPGDLMAELVDLFEDGELHYVLRAWPGIAGWFPPKSSHGTRLPRAVQQIIANNVLLGRVVSVRGLAGYDDMSGVHAWIDKVCLPKSRMGYSVRVAYSPSHFQPEFYNVKDLRAARPDGTSRVRNLAGFSLPPLQYAAYPPIP